MNKLQALIVLLFAGLIAAFICLYGYNAGLFPGTRPNIKIHAQREAEVEKANALIAEMEEFYANERIRDSLYTVYLIKQLDSLTKEYIEVGQMFDDISAGLK
jgi:hypothetical protein